MKTCYFTFGRFNPPTIGHEKLLRTLEKQAASNDYLIYPSQTFKKPNNPLPYDYKVETMKKMFPYLIKLYLILDVIYRSAVGRPSLL